MISTLNEKPLHASLKEWYARPGDRLEVPVGRYVVDIVRDDLLVEIQTQDFSAIKHKLTQLAAHHPVRLVYPIAQEKWIVKLARDGRAGATRRKSPKRGTVDQVFAELVSLPDLMPSRNFSLDVLLIQEEEIRRYDGRRGWRRKGWVIQERRLLDVVARHVFHTPTDMVALLPSGLEDPFTTRDLAQAMGQPRRLAQKAAYCLREMGALTPVGKQGRSILYARSPALTVEQSATAP
jgi:hypothetical protein